MVDPSHTVEPARDLLGDVPARQRRKRVLRRQAPSELVSARALCAQLRRKQPLPDKQRIAHLICLNLISMLEHGARR